MSEQGKRQLKTFMVYVQRGSSKAIAWGAVDAYDTLDALRRAQLLIEGDPDDDGKTAPVRADLIALRADPNNPQNY